MLDTAARGTKRPALSETSELDALRKQLLQRMAEVMEKSEDELTTAAAAAPEATLLDLGLTSAAGVALKRWVFIEMEAELTTFQLLKQPLSVVVEAIGPCSPRAQAKCNPALPQLTIAARSRLADTGRRDDVGIKIPDAQPAPQ